MRGAWILLILACARAAIAQEDGEAAALALADRTQTDPSVRRVCVEYGEVAATDTTYANGMPSSSGGRTSLNVRCDGALGSQWRGVFSDRFDYFWAAGAAAQAVNTLKEAYISFSDAGTESVDVGRINVREGVGFAYNPSDYFRGEAVRTIVSIDPDTLRDERLGTFMARLQTLWSSGALTAIFAPRLGGGPNDSTLSPDWGATNEHSRWLLVLSQRLAADFQPQLSLTGTEHQSPQAGLDLTTLLNSATVAFLEWSGGRSAGNLALSGYGPSVSGAAAFRSRLSGGFTYTTPYKLSVTLEYDYDGAAPGHDEWATVRTGPLTPYVQYREYAGTRAELATRQSWFGYVHCDDAGISHLGLTAFVRLDPEDHSRLTWAEARYHGQHAGLAVQWQRHSGDARSDLAPAPVRQSWRLLIDYYL